MALLPWRGVARRAAELAASAVRVELAPTIRAAGRVSAREAPAAGPLPPFSHAVMDGFALGAPPPGAFDLRPSGHGRLTPAEAAPIATGERIPEGTVVVVLAGRAIVADGLLTVAGAADKDNIRVAGEEAELGDAIIRPGVRLDARHAALAAAAGLDTLPVFARPRVALLGVAAGPDPLPHMGVAAALLDSPALELSVPGVSTPGRLGEVVRRLAAAQDILFVVGESLGDEDGLLAAAVREAGGEAEILRAAMKPAKPILLGRVGAAAVIGLSGTAYAVTTAAHLVLRPALRAAAGLLQDDPLLPAVSGFFRERTPGRAEALPVTARREGPSLVVEMAGRFGQLSALAALEGFALIEQDAGELRPGAPLLYLPLCMPLL
jgi:molybdopterin molybdotransferase